MARYQNRLNRIFSAGIVWDPEEPLPEELQDDLFRSNSETQDILDVLNFRTGYSAAAHVDGPFRDPAQITQPLIQWGQQIAATWPVEGAKKNLPRFTVQEQGRNVLPPLSVTVNASIVQDTARVTVTQLFWNDSGIPIKKAAFTFPLATGCTVTDFSCRIGANKIIKGTVKPKEEAREAFRDHIRQHDTAAGLLEQETPEIFTTTLGNVPEETKVKVELTYISVLKHRFADNNNTTTLTIPTSIAPRYGDAPEEYNDAATTNVPQGLSLEVEIVETEKIASIVSPSHAIAVTRRRGARTAQSFADLAGEDDRSNVETASVALESGRVFLDKDFVLDIVTTPDGNNENPQAWLEEHPSLPNHKTLMLTLPSGFLARKAPPVQQSEILFLADCSGSMKDKIRPLRSAMQFFLKGIPEGRKFNIWCFGTKYASWQPQSVDYTEESLNSALSWVERDMRANMGGTELLPAVQAIVAAREKALMTDVIVLTDGQTWRLEQTLDLIQKTRGLTEGRVRFFALGIGRAVSHALVDGIAKAGGGYAEVVQEASQGGWEDRVVSMAKAALMSAHLGPLHLEFNIQDQTGDMRSSTLADAKRSPADISALNPFDRNRVYFHLDCLKDSESIKSIRVEVQANYDTQTLNIPVTILDKRDTTLHRLAARAMLEDLEQGRSHIHLGPNRPIPGSWQETNMVRKEAEAIACKWSLVSKWTSFFLAEEPYAPIEDDAFMGGVVEIRVSPGDDLLQPHGAVKHIAAIEPADSHIQIAVEGRPAQYTSYSCSPGGSSGSFPVRSLLDFGFRYPEGTLSPPCEARHIAQPGAPGGVNPPRLPLEFSATVKDEKVNIERSHAKYQLDQGHNFERRGPDHHTTTSCPPMAPGAPPVVHERSSDVRRKEEPHDYYLVARSTERASRTRARNDEKYDALQERLRSRFDSSEQRSRGKDSDPGSPSRSDGDTKAGPPKVNISAPPKVNISTPPKVNISTPMGSAAPGSNTSPTLDDFAVFLPEFGTTQNTASPSYVGPEAADYLMFDAVLPDPPLSSEWQFDSAFFNPLVSPSYHNPPEPPTPAQEASQTSNQSRSITRPLRRHVPSTTGQPRRVYPASIPTSAAAPNPLNNNNNNNNSSSSSSSSDDKPLPITPTHKSDTPNPSPPTTPHTFITTLLTFQQYNGSIDFGSWTTATQILGTAITSALQTLQQTWPSGGVNDRAVWTAGVLVLLGRDLQGWRALWELMGVKMGRFCEGVGVGEGGAGLLEVVGRGLEGVRLGLEGWGGEGQREEEGEKGGLVGGVGSGVATTESPAHVRIEDKSARNGAEKSRKKRKVEEKGVKKADPEVTLATADGRFFGPEIEESSRRGTKSRRESATADKRKRVAFAVTVPVPDMGAEEDASDSWEGVEAEAGAAAFQSQNTLRF